ncbi:hypothetical protein [Nocardia brasiliensis]|uniref:hypothetical protein n=1 Tax=Nocardia brasiliensis TaxID=37326 RepID=UPI00245423CA|nr:hypothetical protein [Nocardia brasiliensis]
MIVIGGNHEQTLVGLGDPVCSQASDGTTSDQRQMVTVLFDTSDRQHRNTGLANDRIDRSPGMKQEPITKLLAIALSLQERPGASDDR